MVQTYLLRHNDKRHFKLKKGNMLILPECTQGEMCELKQIEGGNKNVL